VKKIIFLNQIKKESISMRRRSIIFIWIAFEVLKNDMIENFFSIRYFYDAYLEFMMNSVLIEFNCYDV